MPKFDDRFGVDSGCMITGVDLLRGLAVLLGWEVREVEGMTSFHDTNYAGQGEATADALDQYDLVFSHIEAPDEASAPGGLENQGRQRSSRSTSYVVGPVLEKLKTFPEWRHPRHARSSDQHRHAEARVRPDAVRDGRHARAQRVPAPVLRGGGAATT